MNNIMFVWTTSDMLGLILFAVSLVIGGVWLAAIKFIQWRCKHKGGVNETSSCEAICKVCGKNLGFIGTYRESHKENT